MEQNNQAAAFGAFVKAQAAFQVAIKDSTNPHFKSKYADLASCIDSVTPALNSNGLGLMQVLHDAEGGVCVETTLVHTGGHVISGGKLFVPASKQDAQGYGSALTYARRYSLMALCGHAPEDDDGNSAKPAQKLVEKPVAKPGYETVAKEAWNSLDDENRNFLTDIANETKTKFASVGGSKTVDYLEKQLLNDDEKTALWSQFDSKLRSSIKEENKKRRENKEQK